MKNNLDIDIDELPVIDEKASSNRIQSAMPAQRKNTNLIRSGSQTAFLKQSGAANTLSEANLNDLNGGGRLVQTRSFVGSSQGGRPMSASTHTT